MPAPTCDAASPDGLPAPADLCSLVIPVYRNEETIHMLLDALEAVAGQLDAPFEVVFVVDGSPDRSAALLRARLARGTLSAQLICLSRNFGSIAAVRAGLAAARGRYFAVLAADLQEPPELILSFFRTLRAGEADVVLGERIGRDDPATSGAMARLYWTLYRRMVMPEIPPGGVDVFACNRPFRDALLALQENNTSMVGQIFWLGFRRTLVPYRRRARAAGRSAWTFRRKLRYMSDSIFSFTSLPIVVLQLTGALGLMVSVLVAAAVFGAWLAGGRPPAGYTPLMLSIAGATSLILLALGIVGKYVWLTYENTKGRPLVIPMSRETFAGDPGPPVP